MWSYEIEILDEAYFDLEEYMDYIERITFSKIKAEEEEWVKILWEIMKLNFMPYMYQKSYKDFYSFLYKSRRIFYKVYEDKKIIVIFHILWQVQNYEEII
jgi:hypothetical protein